MDTLNTIVTIAISLASLIVAIAALRVAKQSIEVGLYPMRKEVMKKFREEKYAQLHEKCGGFVWLKNFR